MVDTCKCTCSCTGCFKRTSNTVRYSFPKKLLVATSVVVVVAMCLATAEARSIEHRLRHGRRHDTQPTKDARFRLADRRHQPEQLNAAKDSAREYKARMKTISNKLKNTRRYLNQERRLINEWKEYRDGMPSWVPSTNFVTIHYFNFHKNMSNERWDHASMPERKFLFLMPKLYKSLQAFYNIFQRLLAVQVDAPDEAFLEYSKTRNQFMNHTAGLLFSTAAAVKDDLITYNVPIPVVAERNLEKINTKIDAVQSLKNDYIAFRAYSNLLNNWYAEFKCPRGRKAKASKMCVAYETKLRKKKDQRTKSGSS